MSTFKKTIRKLVSLAVVGGVLLISPPLAPTIANAEEMDSSIARGGRLYDKWYKVINAPKPEETHPAWPAANTKKKGAATQRCKACHGWDLMGADGAYASGPYKTGIKGLTAMAGQPNEVIIGFIKDDLHGFAGLMDEQDYTDLANFVSKGRFDIDALIARADKSISGDPAQGERYYNTLCVQCHGFEGRLPKDLPKTLGKIASGNPWETIQKILNGQPAEQMPALRALDPAVSADILAYMVTMPQE